MPNTLKRQNNALLVLDSGAIFYGYGFGAENESVGELCFNTSMTGYQEILTDPSYAGQIINFTFPHIGNVGNKPNRHGDGQTFCIRPHNQESNNGTF